MWDIRILAGEFTSVGQLGMKITCEIWGGERLSWKVQAISSQSIQVSLNLKLISYNCKVRNWHISDFMHHSLFRMEIASLQWELEGFMTFLISRFG